MKTKQEAPQWYNSSGEKIITPKLDEYIKVKATQIDGEIIYEYEKPKKTKKKLDNKSIIGYYKDGLRKISIKIDYDLIDFVIKEKSKLLEELLKTQKTLSDVIDTKQDAIAQFEFKNIKHGLFYNAKLGIFTDLYINGEEDSSILVSQNFAIYEL